MAKNSSAKRGSLKGNPAARAAEEKAIRERVEAAAAKRAAIEAAEAEAAAAKANAESADPTVDGEGKVAGVHVNAMAAQPSKATSHHRIRASRGR